MTAQETSSGPLAGIRVLELASIGPGPHGAMMLADHGADVVRIERRGAGRHLNDDSDDWLLRGRRSIELDLTTADGLDTALRLVDAADVLIEGNRPGVAERLGIGPEVCLARNPGLVYARMTGWGQEGPHAAHAGHDINYLAVTGTLHATGRAGERPTPPLNLVADVAGGSLMLVTGVLAALVERGRTGRGQVIDVAMVDGAAVASQMLWSLRAQDMWRDTRGGNLLDGSWPCYDTYECADGRWVAVGAIEPAFYARLLDGLGLGLGEVPDRDDPAQWGGLRTVLAERFLTRTRDEWAVHFDGTDACVSPVLTFAESAWNPHLASRGTIITPGGVPQAAPAPRFSEHPHPREVRRPPALGADRESILSDWLG